MKPVPFAALLMAVLLVGFGMTLWQRQAMRQARAALTQRTNPAAMSSAPPSNPGTVAASPVPSELLRLRGEVGLLRRELSSTNTPSVSPEEAMEDWAYVHNGSKPSDQPDFRSFTQLAPAGHASPEDALRSFYYAMRNQQHTPLNETRTKEIWDVPDDFDAPGARYSINMGEGMGSETGYRVVDRTNLSPAEIQLTLDFERPDGSSFRRKKTLVERNGLWRMKPASVTRGKD